MHSRDRRDTSASMTDIVTLTINPAIDISTSVERVAPSRKLRCKPPQRDPGGGGINVARVVKRLGGDVAAIYPEGGATGRLLLRMVEAGGVRSLTIEVAEETRVDFTVLEEDSDQQYRFVFPGARLLEAEWRQCLDALASFPDRPKYVVASGSLPAGIPEDFYATAARIAKNSGAKFVLDTSGPALAAALRENVHLIKPNLRELCELTRKKLENEAAWLEACRNLVQAGRAEIVALTLGQRGALLVSRDQALRTEGLPIKPVSAVGAGDSFLGAMVWRLAAGGSLEDAFRYGIAAGSAALITPGTGLCRREDVERLYSRVTVKAVA
jgi:6-phosphofructokinase 2